MFAPLLVVKVARAKYARLLLGALVFVLIGTWMVVSDPSAAWLGWVSIVFFGTGLLVFAKELLDSRPRVVLSDAGVFDRTLGVGLIPWAEIHDAYLASINDNCFVCLALKRPDYWVGQLSLIRRALAKANASFGFQSLSINLSGTDTDPQLVLEIVLQKIYEAGLPPERNFG